MQMQKLFNLCVALALLLSTAMVRADDYEIEVIDLLNRPAAEILPLVTPFVAQGGSITGTDFKLIIKSTPENIEQIKQLLDELDTALRQLVVYVSTDRAGVEAQRRASLSGQAGNDRVTVTTPETDNNGNAIVLRSGEQTRVTGRVYSTDTRSEGPAAQMIRVQEGQWAIIHAGKSIPIAERTTNPDGTVTQTVRYRNVTSGFQVRPQLRGDQVAIDIRPERATVSSSGGGEINIAGLTTTITAQLGEWVELGATLDRLETHGRGTVYSTNRLSEQTSQIFIKIDLR